jgi:uncharacterized protein YbcC (UPF0753/DUF2309 family)
MHDIDNVSPRTADSTDHLGAALRSATRIVAPLWSLENFVAVNPYLGMADRRLDQVAEHLARVAGARTTMPAAFYLAAIDEGRMDATDIARALAGRRPAPATDIDELLRLAARDEAASARVGTVADVAATCTGVDWPRLVTDRMSAWAAAYFDTGQAIWRSAHADDAPFSAWKLEGGTDRTPEINGLAGFRRFVRSLPGDPVEAAGIALAELGVPDAALELYLHRLLFRVGGWAAYAARPVFEAALSGGDDDTLVQFLAALVCWEQGLLRCVPSAKLSAAWDQALVELQAMADDPSVQPELARRLVLHEAFERSQQQRLIAKITDSGPRSTDRTDRPRAQTVSCIDVRSEVLRRHLEAVADDIETIGFAGFFGFPVEHVPLGHERGRAQCPVLLTPAHVVRETLPDAAAVDQAVAHRRRTRHVRAAWKSFRMGAISCFSFVGPVGLAYLPKLFTDATGRTRPVPHPDRDALPSWAKSSTFPDPSASIALTDRVDIAEGALRAMSLTDRFASLVVLAGHGATTVNNPYDSGLACGACGGHTGEANARVAAAVFNDQEVRAGLAARGIAIPDDTWFLAAQHDTTTDDVTVFDPERIPASHRGLVAELEADLAEASRRTRAERAPRMGIAPDADTDDLVRRRSTDWAQVRPEWGLAGCQAFVAAPRERTATLELEGRAFLHSYDWRADDGFGVLELIMTAPMVVASWISLQYFASTVDNELFGSGNKTLHNVVGRLGVFEGTAGDLRVGLPWQSVHDGDRYQHEPVRLTVVIEAPTEAMNGVLAAHPDVKALCDNGWLQLFAMDDHGRVAAQYAGDLSWHTDIGQPCTTRAADVA